MHQLAGPDLAGHRLVQIAWALFFAYTYALVLKYRLPDASSGKPCGTGCGLQRSVRSTDVVSIEVPGSICRSSAPRRVSFSVAVPDARSLDDRHPFSLSAPPAGDRLRLTVKALGQGSAQLQGIALGTWVIAEGPYGAMTASRRSRQNVLLIAVASDHAMRALFETMPLAPGQDLVLLYRARSLSI